MGYNTNLLVRPQGPPSSKNGKFLLDLERVVAAKRRILREDIMASGHIDWTKCRFVEIIPGKVSGRPLLKGTRMPAQDVIDNLDDGMTDIEVAQTYDLDLRQVKAVHAFAEKYRENSAR